MILREYIDRDDVNMLYVGVEMPEGSPLTVTDAYTGKSKRLDMVRVSLIFFKADHVFVIDHGVSFNTGVTAKLDLEEEAIQQKNEALKFLETITFSE